MGSIQQHAKAVTATSLFWIVLFVGYALWGQQHPQAQPIEIHPPATSDVAAVCPATPTAAAPATPAPLRVYVSGAVKKPGVYRLPPESLVVDAIAQAGGETNKADLVAINLAHPLADGEQIYVPTQDEVQATPAPIMRSQTVAGSSSPDAVGNELVDLNTASPEELEKLPGIGPAMAQRIIDGRPYGAVDDLLQVKGIGEAKLAKLQPYVTVR